MKWSIMDVFNKRTATDEKCLCWLGRRSEAGTDDRPPLFSGHGSPAVLWRTDLSQLFKLCLVRRMSGNDERELCTHFCFNHSLWLGRIRSSSYMDSISTPRRRPADLLQPGDLQWNSFLWLVILLTFVVNRLEILSRKLTVTSVYVTEQGHLPNAK